jgi:hypothetical protein
MSAARLLALICIGLLIACATATAAEPPTRTIKRLRAENERLRFQNRSLRYTVDVLYKRIDLLNNALTDCELNRP